MVIFNNTPTPAAASNTPTHAAVSAAPSPPDGDLDVIMNDDDEKPPAAATSGADPASSFVNARPEPKPFTLLDGYESDAVDGIPLPGRMVDGQRQTRKINIEKLRRDKLVELSLGLKVGTKKDNMKTLKDLLRGFSANEDAWDQINPGARRTHRNPQPGTKTSVLKKSAQRRQQLLAISAPAATTATANAPDNAIITTNSLPTIRSTAVPGDCRTNEQIAEVIPWARRIAALYPSRPAQAATTTITSVQRPPLVSIAGNSADATLEKLQIVAMQVTQLLEHAAMATTSQHAPAAIPVPFTGGHAAHQLLGPPVPYMLTSMPPISAPASFHHPLEAPQHPAPSPLYRPPPTGQPVPARNADSLLPQGPERKLMIANGKVITFAENQLRDPPGISFSMDLEGLNAQWDDSSHHWCGAAALKIKGEPIALVYWQMLYSRHRPREWTRVKQKWGEWQALVHRWRQGTPSKFWDEFSADGHRMSYTAICTFLAAERNDDATFIAKRARLDYGSDFDTYFNYRKGSNRVIILRDDMAIAKKVAVLKKNGTYRTSK